MARNGTVRIALKTFLDFFFRKILVLTGCYKFTISENDDWFLDPEDIIIMDAIGEGQFGTVFKGLLTLPETNGQTEVAIKTLKEESSSTDRDKFLAEAFTMKGFDHPHIIILLGVVQIDRKPPWIVMELAEHGELRGYLHRRGAELETSTLLMFTEQVCSIPPRILIVRITVLLRKVITTYCPAGVFSAAVSGDRAQDRAQRRGGAQRPRLL